jgi:protein Mpv17
VLHAAPLLTKAVSSSLLFGASDVCAQDLEGLPDGGVDVPRALTCAALGFLFGPAAHYWYRLMQHSFPRRRVRDTLFKIVLGQTVFGPCFTIVFFGATLCEQSGGLGGVLQLPLKVSRDFLPTQLTGLGFWSGVDLVSYGLIVPWVGEAWIPLFASVANFAWTVYLSCVSARPLPAGTTLQM